LNVITTAWVLQGLNSHHGQRESKQHRWSYLAMFLLQNTLLIACETTNKISWLKAFATACVGLLKRAGKGPGRIVCKFAFLKSTISQ